MKKTLLLPLATICTTVALSISIVAPVSATVSQQSMQQTNSVSTSYENLTEDVKILFTRYISLHNDRFIVNETAIIQDGYADHMQDFYDAAAVLTIYSQSPASLEQDRDLLGYTACVVGNVIGFDFLSPSTLRAVSSAIGKANWSVAAKILGKALGRTVMKKLGGPVGIAISLGMAAWQCRNQW